MNIKEIVKLNMALGNNTIINGIEYYYPDIKDDKTKDILVAKVIDKSIEEAILPDGVNMIDPSGFIGCSKLKRVSIPKGVSVEPQVFDDCESLEFLELPDGLLGMYAFSFRNCTSLRNIYLPKGIGCIGLGAFSGCRNLVSIDIAEGVRIIYRLAFRGCSSLKSVKLPNTLKRIESGAFSDCMELEEITIPESVKLIESFAFENCTNLRKLTILGETDFMNKVFKGCTLQEVTIPKKVVEGFVNAGGNKINTVWKFT